MAEPTTIIYKANNPKIGPMKIPFALWRQFLDQGIGLCIGAGLGVSQGQHIMEPRGKSLAGAEHGANPYLGDGFEVAEFEAEALALSAGGLHKIEQSVLKHWQRVAESSEMNRQIQSLLGSHKYRQPKSEDEIRLLAGFAEFASKSKGFTILNEAYAE